MKYAYWLIAAVILITNLNAGEKGWRVFKQQTYSPTSCHLKKGIEYLEVRLYKTNSDYTKIIDKHYKVTERCYRKPLEHFDPKIVKWFRKIGPNLKLAKETDITKGFYEDGPPWDKNTVKRYTIGGAFFITDKGKVGRMNTIDDIVSFLGDIDTEAELDFVLRRRGHLFCKRYRKKSNGYDVQCEDRVEMETNEEPCGIYRYSVFVSNKGKVEMRSKKRLIKHTECSVL